MQLFVSDLHLCPTRPAATEAFLDFLSGPAAAAQALWILGDLFEYWAGDDDLDDPFNASVCRALFALSVRVPLYLVPGNRDFLLGERFAAATRVRLLADPTPVELYGQPTLLLHGDTLCTDDHAYQAFRAQVRSPPWRHQFLSMPLAERRRQIESLRQRSEEEKRHKPTAIMDVNAGAVAQLLRRHGYPRIIHGHVHRPGRHWHEVDGRRCERWVLADWYDGGSYLACDASGCRAISLR